MLSYERRNSIRQILEDEKTVSAAALAKRFYVSESTIRRDLEKLSGEGVVRRTYGGAVIRENTGDDLPITVRERENADAKLFIAKEAVKLIKNGDAIILDTSSTVTALVPLLHVFEGLTVITNGIKNAYLLNSYPKITTFCTGGRMREHSMSLVGASACERLNEINADIAFISCRGLSLEKGITESSDEEAQIKRAMINAAAKTVLLADGTKIGRVLMNRVCMPDRLFAVVTDSPLPEEFAQYFSSRGISVICGESGN